MGIYRIYGGGRRSFLDGLSPGSEDLAYRTVVSSNRPESGLRVPFDFAQGRLSLVEAWGGAPRPTRTCRHSASDHPEALSADRRQKIVEIDSTASCSTRVGRMPM